MLSNELPEEQRREEQEDQAVKKLVWLVDMSVDGFISGPEGELDWAGKNMDGELWDQANELPDTIDTASVWTRDLAEFRKLLACRIPQVRRMNQISPAGSSNSENRRLPDFEPPYMEKFISAQQ
jgi:hypothetical protein